MTPKLINADIQTWANRLVNYLDTIRTKLPFKTAQSRASEDGLIMWDNQNGYPVVSKDGEFRQVVLSDGKLAGIASSDIVAALPNTGYAIDFDTYNIAEGFTESGGVITFSKPGDFLISFTAQIASTSSSTKHFYFWPRINGTDYAGSTIKASLHENNSTKVVSRTFLFTFNENDTIEAMWGVSDTSGLLQASTSAFAPTAPAATISIVRICR